MSYICDRRGWGASGWGTVWGGAAASVGGDLPVLDPFDIFCVCPGEAMDGLMSYLAVTITPSYDFFINATAHEVGIISEDSVEAELYIEAPISADFTLEVAVTFDQVPVSITEAETRHAFFGVSNPNGFAAGLLLSKTGLAYMGTLGSAKTLIPDTEGLLEEGTLYYLRMVLSHENEAVFIYLTSAAQLEISGHRLIAIMPAIPYGSCLPSAEGVWVKLLGSSVKPAQLRLTSICLSSQVLIPNVPPVADAGPDQAIRTCTILRLDGSQSQDPEGASLVYKWRLIDAPLESGFAFGGLDGFTMPMEPATGFTNKLYSSSFGGSSPLPVEIGDVLFVENEAYDIEGIGSDDHGDYVRIPLHSLPDTWVGRAYKILKQNGLAGSDTVHPTFYPDVPGFYRFDLIVFDGQLYSDTSVTIVNVMESILPRGIIPDTRFLWNYLSDFWRLLDDKERVETVWSGLAQAVATELYTLWQIEYGKSLRDIQRTFTRRWLHYDLLLREPFIELVKLRVPMRGVDSGSILSIVGMPWGGKTFTVALPDGRQKVVTFTGATITVENMAKQVKAALQLLDSRFNCFLSNKATFPFAAYKLRITAPFKFTITAVDAGLPFTVGQTNTVLAGADGFLTAEKTYRLPFSFEGLVFENDLLAVADAVTGELYVVRVASVVDAPTDSFRFQRVVLKDPLPFSAGPVWSFPAKATSSQLDFFQGLVTEKDRVAVEVVDKSQESITYHSVSCFGCCEGIPNAVLFDPFEFIEQLASPDTFEVMFWGVYRRGYMPIEKKIIDIPLLQRVIKEPDEREVLRRNLDYRIETFRDRQCIQFEHQVWDPEDVEVLVPRLWAEYNYLDNRDMIEANFGIPVDFSLDDWSKLPDSIDYLSAVRGLWYTYTNGPRISNIRIGTQILLGLPFAEEAGIIEEIRTDFSPTQGRILIRDTASAEVVRTYPYAKLLELEINPATKELYKVGDSVMQFAPLVTGVEVLDYVKDPTWFQGYIKQGLFYEVEKFFRFMVRINGDVFNLSALLFAKQFVRNIKPTYTFPMFVVTRTVGDTDIDVTDEVRYKGYLRLEDGPLYPNTFGASCGFDEPDPSPGYLVGGVPTPYAAPGSSYDSHYQSAFDTDSDRTQALPYIPTPDNYVRWSFDRVYLCPEMAIWAVATQVLPWESPENPDPDHTPGTVRFDGIFRFDRGVYAANQLLVFGQQFLLHTAGAGQQIKETVVSPGTFWATGVGVDIRGLPVSGSTTFAIEVWVNGVRQVDFDFEHTGGSSFWFIAKVDPPIPGMPTITAFRIQAGDEVEVRIIPDRGAAKKPYWYAMTVTVGSLGEVWHFDAGLTNPFPGYPDPTPFPDATISTVRTL